MDETTGQEAELAGFAAAKDIVTSVAGRELAIVDFDRSIADLGADFKDAIRYLYARSDERALASFNDPAYSGDVGVIMFSGFLERFRATNTLRLLAVSCLVVQDPVAPWYTGSALCPAVADIKVVAETRFPWVKRWILVGQSSGGYAALSLSRLMPHSLCLALGPQTFDDSAIKHRAVQFPPSFHVSITLNAGSKVRDLRGAFFRNPAPSENRVYIVAALSEHENPPTQWLWLDAMHWGRLVDHPDVTVFVTPALSHPVLLRNVETYAQLLRLLAAEPDWDPARLIPAFRAALYGET